MGRSLKSILVSDSLKNIFANLLSLPISIVSSLLIARILGPELTGITALTITLVLNYSINAHFGTLNALSQRYPFLIGQGTTEALEESKRMQSVTLGFVIIGALIAFLIILGLAFGNFIFGYKLIALGYTCGAFIAVLQLFKTYYIFVMRNTNQFSYWSRFTIQFSWVPITWVISAKLGGVMAHWISLATTELLLCITLYYNIGRKIKIIFDLKASWHYMKIGFPIFVVGAMFGFFTTIDRLTAAIFLGTIQLGYYGIASLGATFLGIIPGMIGQLMWPRMAEKLGKGGDNISSLLPYIEKPTYLMSLLLPPLIGIIILIIPIATKILLPKYVPGIEAAQISVLSVFFLGLMGMHTVFLGSSLRLLPYGIITALGIVINSASAYISYKFDMGLEGIAWAKVISYGIISILLLAYVEKLFNYKRKNIFHHLIIQFSPMVFFCFLTFCLIPRIIQNDATSITNMLFHLSLQVMIVIIFSIPFFWLALKRIGVEFKISSLTKYANQLFN